MYYQKLERDINSAFSKILSRKDSGGFRCHEVARLLRDDLTKRGYENVIVRDGKVRYNIDFLVELMLQEDGPFRELFESSLRETLVKGTTKYHLHSWCEIGEIIAEYNSRIEVSPDLFLHGIRIVKKREDLSGKSFYYPVGREFGMNGNRFIYFPPFYLTKLRI